MPQLRVKSGPGKGKIYQITTDSIKIGRETTCLVRLLESGVSREHAEIYRVGEMYFIRDLGSRNGTSVNELTIEDELLRDGDVVHISNCALVFEGSTEAPDAPELAAASEDEHFYDEGNDPTATLTIRVKPEKLMSSVSQQFNVALTKLKRITSEFSEPQTLFNQCLGILFDTIEIQEAYLFTLDNNTLHQRAYLTDGNTKKGKASRAIVLRALQEKTTIITTNAKEDFRFKGESSVMNLNVRSVVCSPLIALGRAVGVIYLNNGPDKTPFTEENSEIVDLVASHVALLYSAVESNTRTKETHNKSIELLEHTVESLIPHLSGRGERVAQIVKTMGEEMELKKSQLAALNTAARLHHLGYLNVGRGIDITRDFLENDRSYVDKTVELLSGVSGYSAIIDIVKYHRSRIDGQGHPADVNPGKWKLESQILALAVELDLRINLPMIFNEGDLPLQEIVIDFLKEGKNIVSSNLINAFDEAYKNGLLLTE